VLYPRPHRPPETAFTGARLSWWLDDRDTAAIQDCCRQLSITPFVFFTAVYGCVLARHGGVSTVLIGSPFMARRTVGAFDLCGFFVNTLPVTVEVAPERTFAQHAGTVVREAVDLCRGNVDVSFNQLVAEVAPDRSTNRNPLFAAMLAMQDMFEPGLGDSPVRDIREPGNGTAKFDLWLGVTPVEGRWLFEIEYDRELIPPAVADGLLTSLQTALRRASADPEVRLADLFDDASAALSARTDGYPAPAPATSLVEWLRETARRRPDAVAIEGPGGTLTYAELERAWTAGATGLTARGVGAGDVVGLCVDTLADTVTTMLAILACGAAYLPLDRGLPDDRLAYMVEQAGCRLIVGALENAAAPVVGLAELLAAVDPDAPGADLDAAAATDEPVGVAGAPMYVMYTSGSTGRPKGVHMGHGPLRNLTGWQIAALGMGSDTRFMQYAPPGFDVSFQEIMPTLAAGGTVVSREPADRRDFAGLAQRLVDTAVTHVYLPVAALRPLVQRLLAHQVRLPALRYLCVSGEQLGVDDETRAFLRDHPHCTLVNLYGPTETQAVTTYRLRGDDPVWPGHVPIGLPIAGVRAYVVDVTGHLAPPGVPGALYLGGVCPADGYINDPKRTGEAFLTDRFAQQPGAVMYRTGDQVLRDDWGQLIFLGRDDDQVKIRGYRIELGELETAACGRPEVREAVALVRDTRGERELVLAVLAEDSTTVDSDAVRQHLARVLPAYMVPTWVLAVDRIPITPTGKTDRNALRRHAEDQIAARNEEAGAVEVVYADELEAELAGLWSQLLGVEGILRDRPVLDYGAHSLLVLAALAQVEQRYGVAAPIIDFFRTPTVATLADLVRDGLRSDA
jgi:amino acid adenylation domain-containing protein